MTSGSDGSAAEARARWARSAQELIGHLVGGKYLIERILGRGGMGTIYAAEQQPLGRKVAVKVLHSNLGDHGADPEFQKRFLLEAATVSQLGHPNIVVVHDYGSLEGDEAACFMVMELLEGKTITQVLNEEGTFSPARALRITREIARALRAAHDLGVIHRDLKPGNVMLCKGPEGETVKVLDFGLVKVLRDDSEELTAEGRFLGSPRYMAPEQIQRLPMDGRTDLYALGVILYRMLCGEVPFAGDHAVQTLMAHLSKPVPPILERTGISVPPDVEAIAMKLMQKEPDDRYPSAEALIAAIDAIWPYVSDEPLVMSGEHVRPRGLTSSAEMTPPSMSMAASGAPTPVSASYSELQPPGPVEAPKKGPPWGLIALAVVGVIAGVGGAALVGSLLEAPDPVTEATPSPDPGLVADPVGPEPGEEPVRAGTENPVPVVAPRTFRLTIQSTPEGADVERDGNVVGQTPLTLELDADALEASPANFRLRMRGHATRTFVQGPSATDLTVEHTLPRNRPTRRGGGGGDVGGDPGGGSGGDMSIKTSR